MSDQIRQSATDKAASNLKPESEKSTLEQAQDQAKSAADSVASTVQPESQKSGTQAATDTASGTGETGQGILASAQETLGNAAQSVSDTLGLSGNSGTSGSSGSTCMFISRVRIAASSN